MEKALNTQGVKEGMEGAQSGVAADLTRVIGLTTQHLAPLLSLCLLLAGAPGIAGCANDVHDPTKPTADETQSLASDSRAISQERGYTMQPAPSSARRIGDGADRGVVIVKAPIVSAGEVVVEAGSTVKDGTISVVKKVLSGLGILAALAAAGGLLFRVFRKKSGGGHGDHGGGGHH